MIKKAGNSFFLLFFLLGFSIQLWGMENIGIKNDIISVIRFGIKNDGSVIGAELNRLVKDSYGKTLYFPAGTYNLSEPIVLPFDYTKNVNIVFDKNALIKSDFRLDALLLSISVCLKDVKPISEFVSQMILKELEVAILKLTISPYKEFLPTKKSMVSILIILVVTVKFPIRLYMVQNMVSLQNRLDIY